MKTTVVAIFVILILAAVSLALTNMSAQAASPDTDISGKLDEIITAQKAIQADIAAMKQELAVIKIRVTQNQ
mgnify:CR=1 FL=1